MCYIFGNRTYGYTITTSWEIGNALCEALMHDDPWVAFSMIEPSSDYDVEGARPILSFILTNGGKDGFDWDMMD